MHKCTKNTRGRGRVIERSEYQEYVDVNRLNIEKNETLYRHRQSIIEPNYVTIKRQWNFHFILTKKGIDRAASDVGFMFTEYNLCRLMNLIDKKDLIKYLEGLAKSYPDNSAQKEAYICYLRASQNHRDFDTSPIKAA